MGKFVCNGAQLKCNQGKAPCVLVVVDPTRPKIQGKLMANIMDNSLANISPFGICTSPSNPAVAATGQAPCTPLIVAPWSPGAKAMIGGSPGLLDDCKCLCTLGGQITVNNPGNNCPAKGE